MASQKDELFGRIAVERGHFTNQQLDEALENQRVMRESMGMHAALVDVLVHKRLLTKDQARDINHEVDIRTGEVHLVAGYEIVSKLGEGGMGTVYRARQVGTDDHVALKILPQSIADSEHISRFRREAEIVRTLDHDNIVKFVEFSYDRRRKHHFYAMEFVDGEDLFEWIERSGRLTEDEAVSVTSQIAMALQHAFFYGLVHRDVKPENIMVTADGTAKLCDLGLARTVDPQATHLTQTGAAPCTPLYVSPEQILDPGSVDIRSDIYSLGATLYHMVAGRPPFDGATPIDIVRQHIDEKAPWPADLNPDLSDGLCRIIMKMMAKAPDDRYQEPNDLNDALDLLDVGQEPEIDDRVRATSKIALPEKPELERPAPPAAIRRRAVSRALARPRCHICGMSLDPVAVARGGHLCPSCGTEVPVLPMIETRERGRSVVVVARGGCSYNGFVRGLEPVIAAVVAKAPTEVVLDISGLSRMDVEESASHIVVWAGQTQSYGGELKVLCSGEALRRFEVIGLSQIIQIEQIAADKRLVRYPLHLGSPQPVEIGMDGPREAAPSPAEAELRAVGTPAAAHPSGARDVPPARPEGEAARAPAEAGPSPAKEAAPHGGGREKEPRQHGERAGGDLKWLDHRDRREKQPPQHRRHTRPHWAKRTILPGVLLGAVAVVAMVLSLLFREGKTTTPSRPVKPPARRYKEGPAGEAAPPPPAEQAQDNQEPGPRGRSLLGVGSRLYPNSSGSPGGSASVVPDGEGEAFAAKVRHESEERMGRMAAGVAPLNATVFRGHGYKLFKQKMRWHEAKLFCEALGGHLVTITSKEENRFVTGLARRAGVSVWLGFTDERKEKKWEWVTGEKVGFTNWSPGNPNNFGGHEDWAEIRRERTGGPLMWNDVARGRPARLRSFVCEWERTGPGPGPDPKIARSRPRTAGDDLSRLFSEFDLSVRKGDYAGARESMKRAAGASANAGIADTLRAAASVAGLLEERRGLIRRAAEIRIGLEITLGTKAGEQKGRLVSFDADGLTLAITRRARDGGTFEAHEEIPWRDLLPECEEGFAADWRGEGADGAIARTYVALGRGNTAGAEDLLAQAGNHPLAVYLEDSLRKQDVSEPKEEPPSPKTAEAEEDTPRTVDVNCPACGGNGRVTATGCPTCDADGYDGASSCTACTETGRRAYNCFACVGGGSVLAGGKQVECRLCGGMGRPPCPACKSTGKISRMNPAAVDYPTMPCATCRGKGFDERLKCSRCAGTGSITAVSSLSATRSSYTRSCKVCGGDGLAPPQCRPCKGRGYRASGFQDRVAACLSCAGTGRLFVPCRACRGRGWQRARPDAAITPSSRQ